MRSSRPAARTGRPAGVVGLVVGLLAGLVVLAPVLGRGVVLSYDMVFVPDPPITATVLATDGSVPRAVPTEMVADLLARAVAAAAVQQALLLAVFVVAGWGAARLLQTRCGSAAAAVAYAWNPYVAERLVIGHWSFLLGYAVLPWVAGAALAYRRGDGPLPPLLLWLGGAALAGSTSALIATGTALAVLGVPDVPLRRRPGRSEAGDPSGRVEPRRSGPAGPAALGLVVGFAAVVNASWLVPALARPGGVPSDPAGVPAFAARADTPLGLVGSIATLGGIWNPAAWPAGRNSALAVVAVAGVAAVVALGTSRLLAASGAGLVAAAAGGLLLAAAGAVPVLDGVLTAVVVHVPGGGLLRDGQKFLAPTALAVALAAGHAVSALAATRRTIPYAVLLGVLPILALPSLGWGVGGRLAATDYPPSWAALRKVVASAPPGEVATLPWGPYRRLGWAGDRIVLDPLPRLLDRRVLVDDDLPLSVGTVRGEDPRAALVTDGLAAGRPLPDLLRRAGVRYAVVHRTQPGSADAEAALAGLPVRYRSEDLLLVELSGEVSRPPPPRPWLAVVGLGLTGLAVAGAAGAVVLGSPSRRLLGSPARDR